jgi:hypothetical protein
VKPPRQRKGAILGLSAVGLVALVVAAFLFAPNQLAEAPLNTCVVEYADDKFLTVDSCDSPFATHSVIASTPISDSMIDSGDWKKRYCENRVDGDSYYSVVEADGQDRIVCLGDAMH